MYFPGELYQTFFRFSINANAAVKNYHTAEIDLFWCDDEHGMKKFIKYAPRLQWKEFLDLRKVPRPSKEFQDVPHTVPLYTPGAARPAVVGLWSVNNHTEQDLYDSVTNYDTVLINFDMYDKHFKSRYRRLYAERMRWLYTVRELFPAKRFLVCGNIFFDFAYCFGMNGVLNKFDEVSARQRILMPDGNSVMFKKSEKPTLKELFGDWHWIIQETPGRSYYWYVYKTFQAVPVYQKNYFENNSFGGHDPSEFSDVDYFFGYIFANTRLTPDKIWTKADVKTGSKDQDTPLSERKQIEGLLAKRFIYNDAMLCDTCSLNYCCKLYRPKGVCLVPTSKGAEFSSKFASTNAQDILDGMGELLQKTAVIVEQDVDRAIKNKQPIDKETRTAMKDLFQGAGTLAKLRDPSLTKPQIQIGINQTNGALPPGQTVQISQRDYAAAIREIEKQGFDREKITQEMVTAYVTGTQTSFADQPQLGPADDDTIDAEIDEAPAREATKNPGNRDKAQPANINDTGSFHTPQPEFHIPPTEVTEIEQVF